MGARYEGTIVELVGSTRATARLVNQTTITMRARNVGRDLHDLAMAPIGVYVYGAESENPFAAGILRLVRS
jgi:hypothetical protein